MVDDDLDEEEAIKVTEKKNLENDIEDETLEIDKIVNIKESRNHPLENVIGNLNQRTLRSQAQNQSNFFCFISTIEPKNVNEALTDESWIITMQEELNQFIANDVWELVPQPRNMKIIGTKWVFRNKLDENGIVSRNKARKQKTALAIITTEVEYCKRRKVVNNAPMDETRSYRHEIFDSRLSDRGATIKATIDLSKKPVQHSEVKHIKIRPPTFFVINVRKGHISIEKVLRSIDNIADILTKPLKRESFNYLRHGLGMMEHIP
ncbi:hypothetical protein Tco_1368224 [Tanacetum coccineum]